MSQGNVVSYNVLEEWLLKKDSACKELAKRIKATKNADICKGLNAIWTEYPLTHISAHVSKFRSI